MATKISWCDETINPITGCTPISAGCAKCYAAGIAKRFWGDRKFSDIQFHPERLDAILHVRKPRKIFLDSMGDIFHKDVDPRWIDRILWNVAEHNRHTYMMLTKRADAMQKYFTSFVHNETGVLDRVMTNRSMPHYQSFHKHFMAYRTGGSIPNLWLGVTAENQQAADERIPLLLKTPAAVRFVSVEPMLEEIDLERYLWGVVGSTAGYFDKNGVRRSRGIGGQMMCARPTNLISQIIVGCESGQGRRECKIEWIESIVNQCGSAGVPVFVKQLNINGKVVKDWNDPLFPEHLKIREFPNEN
jgi:protein gp37